jgi:hypothetical protein
MLRRAEEGIGESFGSSLRKLMDGNLETIYYRALNSGDATDQGVYLPYQFHQWTLSAFFFQLSTVTYLFN